MHLLLIKVLTILLMRKHTVAILIAATLFVVPFFWLKPGFVDLGGDAGRLYFLDPFSVTKNLYQQQNLFGASIFAIIPYQLFLALLKQIVLTPTYLISLEHGIQLSVSFYSIYLILRSISKGLSHKKNPVETFTAIAGGLVYVGFITKTGWVTSLETFNQIFLNPLMFYLLLRYVMTSNSLYALCILGLTFLYSQNFGFSSMPQLMSFYPFAIVFLFLYIRVILKKSFPWKNIVLLFMLFVGLHAFQLVPMIGSIFDSKGVGNAYIFSKTAQTSAGAEYFDANRQTLGKLSWGLFQPLNWNGNTLFIAVIPIITFLGFFIKRNTLLAILGSFFVITFYLVSANITIIGVRLYRLLFSIPGFLMFRSFDDKWYYVFSFFFTVLFAVSFFLLLHQRRKLVVVSVFLLVSVSVIFRIFPFLQGKHYEGDLFQSNNVPVVFDIDPDLMESLSFVKTLPDDGNALTLPLTLPYFQVIHGKQSGAFVGLSMVRLIGGKDDYPGFWSFGSYQEPMIQALRDADVHKTLQLLSLLNVRYIYRNTDQRILDKFPRYPYYKFDMTIDIPTINSQSTYDDYLRLFPLTTLYEKGFYRIQKLSDTVVRPTVYIPDVVYASQSGAIENMSFRSAYVDPTICLEMFQCDLQQTQQSKLSFTRLSPVTYTFDLDMSGVTDPFLIILSEDFHPSWKLKFNETNDQTFQHVVGNGYANAWVVDPAKTQLSGNVSGIIELTFKRYFVIGNIISGITVLISMSLIIYRIIKKYEHKP